MAATKLFGGYALRRLRRREGLTQVAMAEAAGISPSYLNLLERNQRPISAPLLLKLAERFDVDPRHFAADAPGGGLDAMMERLRDGAFSDLAIDRTEVEEWLAAAPATAQAFVRLHDRRVPDAAPLADPAAAAREATARWHNHFPDLDAAAERLADELRLTSGEASQAIPERLRERHRIAIRILPSDVLGDSLQRLDLHARQLQLCELLDPASRIFAAALQLARFELADEVEALVAGAELTDRVAIRHLRRALFGWAAAAIVLPYGRFLRACEATGYDLHRLQRRFGVGHEVLAHRLTALGRVGARGLPFGLLRLDRAGQLSQRVAGASASPLVVTPGLCPLWLALRASERAGELVGQVVELEDATRWLTVARTVWAPASGAGGQAAQFTIVLVLDTRFADALGPSHASALDRPPQPIGPGCARCGRTGCPQRALPSPLVEGDGLAPLGLA